VPPAAVMECAAAGKVEYGGVDVGRVGMGVVVRPGAPVPDISTADAVKRTVLEAESIAFNRASSGLYFEGLLKKMGVYEQVEPKAARYATGAQVMEHVLKGKGREVGFGPITEILQYKDKGLRLVGPLPSEIQNLTAYVAVPMSAGANKALAGEFARFLGGSVGRRLFVAAGIE
jgi:molybdate transport system substrate-binding protein